MAHPSPMAAQQGRGTLAVLAAALLWGTTGTAATFAPEVGPAAIGAAAMGLGGLAQALWAAPQIAAHGAQLRGEWRLLIWGGMAVAIYPLAFYGAMRLAGVTIGTVITIGAAPLFAALLEYFFERTKLRASWAIAAALGIIGMTLICLGENAGHATLSPNTPFGVILGLIGALSYALFSWTARQMMQKSVASRAAMGATFGLGGLMLMPVLFATGQAFLTGWGNAMVGLYMAFVPMFLGYLCFGYGLARISASRATTITLFEPVIAAILAVWLVGERLSPLGWFGVVLVIACLGVITAPLKSRP